MIKPTKCLSAQSDQSLHYPYEETLDPHLPNEPTAKTDQTDCGCPGWSESSLGALISLLVLSWGSSYCSNCRPRRRRFKWVPTTYVFMENWQNYPLNIIKYPHLFHYLRIYFTFIMQLGPSVIVESSSYCWPDKIFFRCKILSKFRLSFFCRIIASFISCFISVIWELC